MNKAIFKACIVIILLILLFSCRALFCDRAFALFPAELLASNDIIAFGGDDGSNILQNSTEITLEMEYIGEDLFWTGTSNDIDGLLIRTMERSAEMDAVFHLP